MNPESERDKILQKKVNIKNRDKQKHARPNKACSKTSGVWVLNVKDTNALSF